MRADIHQHLWTQSLLDALSVRHTLPYVRRANGLTIVHSAGERAYVIDVDAEAMQRRTRMLAADGLDLALIALSSPIGIEALPRCEARELIDAHLEGVGRLGPGFGAWGPVALDHPDPSEVDELLARGCAGISLPAGALALAEGPGPITPVFERVAALGVPLFVHPGPGLSRGGGVVATEASLTEPLWWRALTDYVAQMQAAWLTFATVVRREHPELVVVFAMLAGGAPLHSERLATRGGPAVALRDPGVFYDCSSYGPAAVAAIARIVGAEQLVYGSDRPVVQPIRGGEDRRLQRNAARLVARAAVVA